MKELFFPISRPLNDMAVWAERSDFFLSTFFSWTKLIAAASIRFILSSDFVYLKKKERKEDAEVLWNLLLSIIELGETNSHHLSQTELQTI